MSASLWVVSVHYYYSFYFNPYQVISDRIFQPDLSTDRFMIDTIVKLLSIYI